MNRVDIVGRLVRDPEIRYTAGEKATAIARFTVVVNRKFKNADGNYDADFISCQAFGRTAEFIEKWFKKGSMIGCDGEIRTGSYTNKDGQKVYTTDVVVSNVEFVGGKSDKPAADDSFMDIPDGVEEELPF